MQYPLQIPKDMLWSPKIIWNTLRGVMHVNQVIMGIEQYPFDDLKQNN
jgi:hypothetical protein